MQEVIKNLVDVPFARMFVLAGIVFLLVAVLGKVEGKIDPGNMGRIGASVLGVVLMIIGIVMQYFEIRELAIEKAALQARLMPVASVPADTAAVKQPDAASAVAADKPVIKVVSGTYGRSCNVKTGNATQQLAKSCDGKSACDHAVEPVALDGVSADCARDFAAEWKCGSGSTVYSATLPATASKSEKLHLACAG